MSLNHLFDVLHNRHKVLTCVEHVNKVNWNTNVQLDCNTWPIQNCDYTFGRLLKTQPFHFLDESGNLMPGLILLNHKTYIKTFQLSYKTRLWLQSRYGIITTYAYVLFLLLNTFSKSSCDISFWHLIISCRISSACFKSPIFTQYRRSLCRAAIASKLFTHIAKAAKSFCCSLLAVTLSTLSILSKNVYIIVQLYWLMNQLTQSFYPHAVPSCTIWRGLWCPANLRAKRFRAPEGGYILSLRARERLGERCGVLLGRRN